MPQDKISYNFLIDTRESIDNLDNALLSLIAEKLHIIKKLKNDQYLTSPQIQNHYLPAFFIRLNQEKKYLQLITEINDSYSFNEKELDKHQKQIDELINNILIQRFELVKKIGLYKKKMNLPAYNPTRWKELLTSKTKLAAKNCISPSLIKDLFNIIHTKSLEIEENIVTI